MTIALIDGDVLVYRCGFAAQKTQWYATNSDGAYLGPFESKAAATEYLAGASDFDLVSEVTAEPVAHALYTVREALANIIQGAGCSNGLVFLSSQSNFRKHVAKTLPYKGNRSQPKPVHYDAIREYLLNKKAQLCIGYEADDAIAAALTEQPDQYIACSIDKDLLQVPGRHWNWVRQEAKIITEEVGEYLLWSQVLTGDQTDNIPGIPGIGPVKAERILRDVPTQDLQNVVLEQYLKAGLTEERMKETYELVYLLRTPAQLQQAQEFAKEHDAAKEARDP